jgi:ABC-type Fe3+-siderophore transport system permease subunit
MTSRKGTSHKGTSRKSDARVTPAIVAALLFAVAIASALVRLAELLPFANWWQAAVNPDVGVYAQILVHDSFLPRLAVALLAGGALGLSGAVFQQVLRTPLADPSTLGVSAGAYLALALATVWVPGLAISAREVIALFGALAAFALVFIVALPHRLSPLSLILAGLVITLVCGAVSAAISLFYGMGLTGLFIWGSGSLNQNDWSAVSHLAPRLALCCVSAGLLARPLALLSLSDESARSLGLSLFAVRGLSIVIAILLAAFTVSAVGVIGFVGLAAPVIARTAGARRLLPRMIWSVLIGSALLLAADEALQQASRVMREIPAGAATAFLGVPLILLLLKRLHPAEVHFDLEAVPCNRRPARWLAAAAVIFLGLVWLSLSIGPSLHGWTFSTPAQAQALMIWRLPRLAAAAAGGVLFALSGTVIQRMTGNPMARPELIGVSTGAALGILLLVVSTPIVTPASQLLAATAGSVISLLLILALARRGEFRPDQVLLLGVALNTAFVALITVMLGTGLPRIYGLLQWMAGSTYSVTPMQAVIAVFVAVLGLAVTPLFARWLDLLPLGGAPARALGLNLSLSRAALLVLSAFMAAAATLLIGPLSFVGLMAPHMARALGFQRALPQLLAAAILGPLIMTLADFIGRVALFPNQLPVGIVATLIGGPYFLFLMRRRVA